MKTKKKRFQIALSALILSILMMPLASSQPNTVLEVEPRAPAPPTITSREVPIVRILVP